MNQQKQLVEQKWKHYPKTYNKTIIPQYSIWIIKLKHKYQQKLCRFFLVLRNSQALLGMPDIETPDVLPINCNMIDMQTEVEKPKIRWKQTAMHKLHRGNRQGSEV